MMIQPWVISAPFGNTCNYPNATSTLGTFTLNYRGGRLYRLWRCLRTLRYSRAAQGWVNKLGLPNPGIDSIKYGLPAPAKSKIVSIHGFNRVEWLALVNSCYDPHIKCAAAIEFNLSCPNVNHESSANEVLPAILAAIKDNFRIIAKLPPVRWMELAVPLYSAGVRTFHACNTLPTARGGLSGKSLKPLSLWAVSDLRQKWGDTVTIIGGGGVTHPQDAEDYRQAGADHVAVGSVLLNPLNWLRVRRMVGEQEIKSDP